MFFRFCAATLLIVLISLAGVALGSRNLELRRSLSRQHYQLDLLLERHARLRLQTQRSGAPPRLLERVQAGQLPQPAASPRAAAEKDRPPLLWWRSPPPP